MKLFKRLAIVGALVCVLAVSAFAADFTHCADALKDLGLFSGTAKGYELDRAPTRAEAAAMLVRLMGQEAEAQKLTYTAPFTDLADWAKPYVQYLYDNGLTAGKTATTFAPTEPCTAQMYATFLMRALGYSDKSGEFTYDGAIAFAKEKGVINAVNCDEKNFLRDHVVAMSYTALATETAGGEASLLSLLMKAGVITDGKGYDMQFSAYRAYSRDMAAATAASANKSHMKMDMTIGAKIAGVDFLNGTMTMDMMMDLNMDKMDSSKLSATSTMDMTINPVFVPTNNTMKQTMENYYADGVFYSKMGDQKIKQAMSFEAIQAQMGDMAMDTGVEPICMLKSISVKDGVYTISYAGGSLSGMMRDAMASMETIMGQEAPTVAITKMESTVAVKDGKITSQKVSMGMDMTMEGQTVNMTMDMNLTDVGGTVNVVLPTDLATYAAQMTPAA